MVKVLKEQRDDELDDLEVFSSKNISCRFVGALLENMQGNLLENLKNWRNVKNVGKMGM